MDEISTLKKKTISGIAWKGLERVCAQIVSTLVAIILARILIPEDYAVVSIVTIFFAFCNVFISSGLNTALIQKKAADKLDYSTILVTNLSFALVLYVIIFFAAPFLENLFHQNSLALVLRVMALTFFISGYKAVVSAKIMSDLAFKKFFWSTLIGTLVSAVVGIVMALKGFGAWALIAQQMANTFIDSLILTFTSKIKISFLFSWNRFKKLFGFGGKIMFASLINEIYNQIKPVIIGIKFSAVDLAYYNKGRTYPNMLATTSNDTLSSSLFPAMSKVQDDKTKILSMTRRFMQLSSFIVFPVMLGFFAVSENFVRVVLTDKWLPIVPFLMVFCVSEMFKPLQTGNLQAIKAIGRSDVFLRLEIIKKVSYLVIIFLFVFLTNSPLLLAISGIITSILASLINTFPNKKLIGYSYFMQFKDLFINFITSFLMCVVVYKMNFLQLNIYLLLFLQIITGALLYFAVNILIRNPCLDYLKNIMKLFFERKK